MNETPPLADEEDMSALRFRVVTVGGQRRGLTADHRAEEPQQAKGDQHADRDRRHSPQPQPLQQVDERR